MAVTAGDGMAITADGFFASLKQGIRLFTYKLGMRLYFGKNDISLQALKQFVNFSAAIEINERANEIRLIARDELSINGGGSTTTLNSGEITHATSGKFTIHSTSLTYTGAKNLPVPAITSTELPSWLELKYTYADQKPMVGAPYKLFFENGDTRIGTLDTKGFARLENIPNCSSYVEYGEDCRQAQPAYPRPDNAVYRQPINSLSAAQALRAAYIVQEDEYLLDNYFPDEVANMQHGNDHAYFIYANDYEYEGEVDPEAAAIYADEHSQNPQGENE